MTKEGEMDMDLRGSLCRYFPILIELLNDQQISWRDIDKSFAKVFYKRQLKIEAEGDGIEVSAHFFDLVTHAEQGNPQACAFLNFIKKLFEELCDNLYPDEQGKIAQTVKHLLTSKDFEYLNYVGELALLNQLIKSGMYRLGEVEVAFGNGKRADFLLVNTKTKATTLLEVVNIHCDQRPGTSMGEQVKLKLKQKVENQTKGQLAEQAFYLGSIIWTPSNLLVQLAEELKLKPIVDKHCLEPCSFLSKKDDQGNYYYFFGTLSTLLHPEGQA